MLTIERNVCDAFKKSVDGFVLNGGHVEDLCGLGLASAFDEPAHRASSVQKASEKEGHKPKK